MGHPVSSQNGGYHSKIATTLPILRVSYQYGIYLNEMAGNSEQNGAYHPKWRIGGQAIGASYDMIEITILMF